VTRSLLILLIGGCASGPVVTGGGASDDGQSAWFAVTEGDELTFYRCVPSGCAAVPQAGAPPRMDEPSTPEPAPSEPAEQPSTEVEDDHSMPDEERMDLMDGVL